jgi:hypothetical protein
MKLEGKGFASKHGKGVSVSVENITPFGIWLYVKEKEYFLGYKEFPYFRDQTLASIQNVQLLHGYHLYWPDLDIDLEIDNLEYPERYPLKTRVVGAPSNHSPKRAASGR